MDIINLCKAVIHLESIHNRTTIRTAYDKDIVNLLNKGAEVQAQLLRCDQHLAKVSDIVPLIEVSGLVDAAGTTDPPLPPPSPPPPSCRGMSR